MARGVDWMERHQVALHLLALLAGAAVALLFPAAARPAGAAVTPVLGLLLYVTFLGVPFGRLRRAFRDWRFLATLLGVNFIVVPVVVFALSRLVAHDQVLLIGVLLVLLTPCVDYVIVFTGLAGGARDRLIAATPMLMLAQILLLPLCLWLFTGDAFVQALDLRTFVEAFLLLIVLPLAAAGLTRLAAARTGSGPAIARAGTAAMVPLMMLTLAVVVASQIVGVRQQIASLLLTIPVYVLFAAVMIPVGLLAGSLMRLEVPARRAVVFSGTTRNSLVVLPLALALPPAFDLVPLVVVTQTLIELMVMVICIRLVPRIIPESAPRR